jgi:hypothetical protein
MKMHIIDKLLYYWCNYLMFLFWFLLMGMHSILVFIFIWLFEILSAKYHSLTKFYPKTFSLSKTFLSITQFISPLILVLVDMAEIFRV